MVNIFRNFIHISCHTYPNPQLNSVSNAYLINKEPYQVNVELPS
jgi:hypothetical protein